MAEEKLDHSTRNTIISVMVPAAIAIGGGLYVALTPLMGPGAVLIILGTWGLAVVLTIALMLEKDPAKSNLWYGVGACLGIGLISVIMNLP